MARTKKTIKDIPIVEHIGAIEKIAKEKFNLDFFPMVYEMIPEDFMLEICTYGLPTRFNHWSFGVSYKHQKFHGDMGFSKVYEVVLNNNPCPAFLLENNPLIANLLVVSHVLGHSHFFKHNVSFENTDRNMISHANNHANRIENYVQSYGIDAVEQMLDIAFSLDNHIDLAQGLYREKYPTKKIIQTKNKTNKYDQLVGRGPELSMSRKVINDKIPPHQERDLLWFFSQYADLEDWQRDILDIVREESYYFYPQYMTKILNEGFASACHAEIMREYLDPADHLDFTKLHSSVVSPGSPLKINPYYLGFKILEDIKKRWDLMYEGKYKDKEGKVIKSDITGWEKILKVVGEENDISFLRNYLTYELADKLKLFVYGYSCEHMPGKTENCEKCGEISIQSRSLDDIIRYMIEPKFNYGAPIIVIDSVEEAGDLILKHLDYEERGPLELTYAEATINYIYQLWKHPIHLYTKYDDGKRINIHRNKDGFDILERDVAEKEPENLITLDDIENLFDVRDLP